MPHQANSLSSLTERISRTSHEAWAVHSKAMERRRAGEDIIILSVGEDLAIPAPGQVVAAAKQSLDQGRHHYAPSIGEFRLRELMAKRHRERTGQAVGPEHCVTFAGAQNALFATSLCLLEAGDEIIAAEPYYTTYPSTFTAAGAELIAVPGESAAGFQLDAGRIAAAVTPKSKAIVINSPNNPTGAVYPRGTITAVAEICRRHDLWLISDEVYASLSFAGESFSPSSLPWMQDRCITVTSLSKSHWMAGWRVGWAVAPPALVAAYTALNLCMLYGLPPFIQDAAQQALSLPAEFEIEARARYRRRRDAVCAQLAQIPGLRFSVPQGGMFVFADIRQICPDAKTFAFGLLDACDVSVLPADGFGKSGEGHIRIGLTADIPVLIEACNRIADFIGTIKD